MCIRDSGEVVGELLEGVAARHEVGLHADLHEHADLAAGVDVRIHGAVFGRSRALLLGAGEALLAQLVHRLLEVAAGRSERLLAVHHPGSALLAELLYQCSGDLSHSAILSQGRRLSSYGLSLIHISEPTRLGMISY